MAGKFLRSWFGKSAALAPDVKDALDELNRLAVARSFLSGPIDLFKDILPTLFADSIREQPPTLTLDQVTSRLADGIPLWRGEKITLDEAAFCRRWDHLCAAVQRQRSDNPGQQLMEALHARRLDPQEMLEAVLAGQPDQVFTLADRLGLDAALTGTILRWALFPVLAHLNTQVKLLRQGLPWEQGYCPVCGSWPLLAEFRGLEQVRFLRCELCATAWEHPRLACPFCSTRDHRALGYLHVEGEESSSRAATCEACHTYVKIVATLGELSPPRLLVADLATAHLDLAAGERGYTRHP